MMLGAMDAPENYPPTVHGYVREELPFFHLDDVCPHGDQYRAETRRSNSMKFTLSWLKDHLETDATLEQICARLTAIGLEVEEVDDKAAFKPS